MLVRFFSHIAAASMIVVGGTLGFMVTDRDPPIEIKKREILRPCTVVAVDRPCSVVVPGWHLEQRLTVVQHKRCFIHSDRAFYDVNNERILIEPLEFQAGVGEVGIEQTYVSKIPVPPQMAFGRGRYESTTVYRCNLVHWFWPIYVYTRIDLEVVPL